MSRSKGTPEHNFPDDQWNVSVLHVTDSTAVGDSLAYDMDVINLDPEQFESRENNTAEIATISDQYFKTLESYSVDILDLRFELKENVTRKEWAQIFAEE